MSRKSPATQPCTNANCALLPSHRLDNPGCTSFVGTGMTVFTVKGRRATTRAKEERGGGRRNASRPKTFGQALGEAVDRVLQAAPNKSVSEVQLPCGHWSSKGYIACGFPGCTGMMESPPDFKGHRLFPEHELADLKAAVRELIAAESSQTKGAYNLGVKGAARQKMIAKEKRRLAAAWVLVQWLSAES